MIMKRLWPLAALALVCSAGAVSPRAADAQDMGQARAAAERALTAAGVRLSEAAGDPRAIVLGAQDVELSQPLRLGPDASGAPGAPLVIRAAPGAQVRLFGSAPLGAPLGRPSDASLALIPAAARAHVLAYRLDADTGRRFAAETQVTPGGDPSASVMLTQAGQALTMARWPQTGYAQTPPLPAPPRTPVFAAPPQKASIWAHEPALRAGGYWEYDWAYETVLVTVDPVAGVVRGRPMSEPYPPAKQYRFFIYNAVSELSRPGEFAVSPATHELLVWPLQEGPGAPPVRLVAASRVLEIDGVHDLRIEGLQFTDALDSAVVVEGSSAVTFDGDFVANAGRVGIAVQGGQNDLIVRSVIADTGSSGVAMSGGDRATLSVGGHRLVDSIIVRTGQRARSNHAGVALSGVGLLAQGNLIRYGPHEGLSFHANDARIVGNEIADVVTETADAGAIYTGRDPSARGDVIEANYFHDVYARAGEPADVRGVYLDDFTSGDVVRRNVFFRVRDPVYMNGGSSNLIQDNIFLDTFGQPVTVRDATDQWAAELEQLIANTQVASEHMALYLSRYPDFRLPTPTPRPPADTVEGNQVLGGPGTRAGMTPRQALLSLGAAASGGAAMDRESALADLPFYARARVDWDGQTR
jgi:hypothetical protein